MKLWSLVRGYSKNPIENEMKKVKFTSKTRNTERDKSLTMVPFVMTYHPEPKSVEPIYS